MNKIQQLLSALIIFGVVSSATSCKKTFDAPPGPSDNVNVVANTSIQGLKTYHTIPQQIDVITQDVIISGIVVANDESGNFYKQLFIQDTTGAMQIMLDASSLYTSYPVGRRVYVKCKGLALSDYYGNMQLGIRAVVGGVASVQAIPAGLISQYVVGGSLNNPVEPIPVNIADLGTALNDRYINALVKLSGYEFVAADTSKIYSDTSSYKSTQNRLISTGCGSSVKPTVRTSAYANFAGQPLPKGNGDITAIYTIYKSFTATKQLIIRDTSDVQFYNSRCGGGGGTAPTDPHITIAALRAMFTGNNIKLTTPASIGGIVTSDIAQKNISTGAVVIEDETAAITVYFGGALAYNIGDSIAFNITGDSLLNYRGSLELKTPAGTAYPSPIAVGKVVTPKVKTIAELNAALDAPLGSPLNFELSMVKIMGATASGGTTFSGNKTLTDATGTITLYTATAALFSGNALPTGPKNWTGQIKWYGTTTKEFLIRNAGDVQ